MLAELEIKGGYIEPTNRGDPTLKASKKQGAKIIDSTTRLPKDLDPFEQNMSVQQFVPENGYHPVNLVTRGLNLLETAYYGKSMTYQRSSRPSYKIDPKIESTIDLLLTKVVKSRSNILDAEDISIQQLRQAMGIDRKGLFQLPLEDKYIDTAYKMLQGQIYQNDLLKTNVGNKIIGGPGAPSHGGGSYGGPSSGGSYKGGGGGGDDDSSSGGGGSDYPYSDSSSVAPTHITLSSQYYNNGPGSVLGGLSSSDSSSASELPQKGPGAFKQPIIPKLQLQNLSMGSVHNSQIYGPMGSASSAKQSHLSFNSVVSGASGKKPPISSAHASEISQLNNLMDVGPMQPLPAYYNFLAENQSNGSGQAPPPNVPVLPMQLSDLFIPEGMQMGAPEVSALEDMMGGPPVFQYQQQDLLSQGGQSGKSSAKSMGKASAKSVKFNPQVQQKEFAGKQSVNSMKSGKSGVAQITGSPAQPPPQNPYQQVIQNVVNSDFTQFKKKAQSSYITYPSISNNPLSQNQIDLQNALQQQQPVPIADDNNLPHEKSVENLVQYFNNGPHPLLEGDSVSHKSKGPAPHPIGAQYLQQPVPFYPINVVNPDPAQFVPPQIPDLPIPAKPSLNLPHQIQVLNQIGGQMPQMKNVQHMNLNAQQYGFDEMFKIASNYKPLNKKSIAAAEQNTLFNAFFEGIANPNLSQLYTTQISDPTVIYNTLLNINDDLNNILEEFRIAALNGGNNLGKYDADTRGYIYSSTVSMMTELDRYLAYFSTQRNGNNPAFNTYMGIRGRVVNVLETLLTQFNPDQQQSANIRNNPGILRNLFPLAGAVGSYAGSALGSIASGIGSGLMSLASYAGSALVSGAQHMAQQYQINQAAVQQHQLEQQEEEKKQIYQPSSSSSSSLGSNVSVLYVDDDGVVNDQQFSGQPNPVAAAKFAFTKLKDIAGSVVGGAGNVISGAGNALGSVKRSLSRGADTARNYLQHNLVPRIRERISTSRSPVPSNRNTGQMSGRSSVASYSNPPGSIAQTPALVYQQTPQGVVAYINADINRNETGNAGRRYPHAPYSSISMLQEYLNNGQLEMADSIYMGIVNRTVARVGNEISALNGDGSNVNVTPMPGNTTPLNKMAQSLQTQKFKGKAGIFMNSTQKRNEIDYSTQQRAAYSGRSNREQQTTDGIIPRISDFPSMLQGTGGFTPLPPPPRTYKPGTMTPRPSAPVTGISRGKGVKKGTMTPAPSMFTPRAREQQLVPPTPRDSTGRARTSRQQQFRSSMSYNSAAGNRSLNPADLASRLQQIDEESNDSRMSMLGRRRRSSSKSGTSSSRSKKFRRS